MKVRKGIKDFSSFLATWVIFFSTGLFVCGPLCLYACSYVCGSCIGHPVCFFLICGAKPNPCVLGSHKPVLGMKIERLERNLWLFFKPLLTVSIKRSRRGFSIDMIIFRDIFKNTQITLYTCFIFIPQTGIGQPKTGFVLFAFRI